MTGQVRTPGCVPGALMEIPEESRKEFQSKTEPRVTGQVRTPGCVPGALMEIPEESRIRIPIKIVRIMMMMFCMRIELCAHGNYDPGNIMISDSS